jgi:hypothetical protein
MQEKCGAYMSTTFKPKFDVMLHLAFCAVQRILCYVGPVTLQTSPHPTRSPIILWSRWHLQLVHLSCKQVCCLLIMHLKSMHPLLVKSWIPIGCLSYKSPALVLLLRAFRLETSCSVLKSLWKAQHSRAQRLLFGIEVHGRILFQHAP